MTHDEKNWCQGKKIGVIGGDLRQLITARELETEGFTVVLYAIDTYEGNYGSMDRAGNLADAIADCDMILLPLPVTRNGYTLNTPLSEETVTIAGLFEQIEKSGQHPMILGGRISEKVSMMADAANLDIIDYFAREELQISNAIPTTEGAIAIAMNHFPYTLHNSNCTVLGFGRVGKVLSKTLHALGANVRVVARREADLAWADAMGCSPVPLSQMNRALCRCQILFNTVPYMLISEKQLALLPRDAILIDLASSRGIDAEQAKKHGNEIYWALSLPGKVAPATAGCIIKESVMHILAEAFGGGDIT